MNIFVTHNNPVVAAKHLCDRHVPKMLLESAQMLSNAVHIYGNPATAPYKPMYLKHPCSKWVLESRNNFLWLFKHARAIQEQFVVRFGPSHKCIAALDQIESQIPTLKFNRIGRTTYIQCMPKIYRQSDTIRAYRSYIKHGKSFARWKKGVKKPSWFKNHRPEFNVLEVAQYIKSGIRVDNIPHEIVDLSASIASVI